MGSQENKLITLYIELRDGLRELEERFYTIIPMYHRDYTDSPENFAHEMTYKRYCKTMDEREKAEDARYTLENMVYPHFDIDDIYGEADQEGGETRSQMEEKASY